MKPKIIVCGLGRTGLRVFSLLQQQGAECQAIAEPLTTYGLPSAP